MVRQRAPITSGVLTTAGGVTFDATFDRVFHAYDSATGREVWHSRLNDVSGSSPIAFAVNRGAAVWVFALP
jgi:alcohol dehydrogenase (cytochrome c)